MISKGIHSQKIKKKNNRRRQVSNLRSPAYNAGMLTTELNVTLLECYCSKWNKQLALAWFH
jgi:hypothetical protein